MRAGFGQFNHPSRDFLIFCAQFGASDILLKYADSLEKLNLNNSILFQKNESN